MQTEEHKEMAEVNVKYKVIDDLTLKLKSVLFSLILTLVVITVISLISS